MNDFRLLLSGRFRALLIIAAYVALLIATAALRPARAADLTPLPAAPATGWCYAGTVCNAQRICTYAGVQACPDSTVVDPPGRQRAAQIRYPNAPGSRTRTADLAFWDSLFGHRTDTDPVSPWPGAAGTAPAVMQFTGDGYVALEFTPTRHAQVTVNVSSYNGVVLDGAWSTRVGDFGGSAQCTATRGPGESFPKLSSDPARPGCYFAVGQRAYFNMRRHVAQAAGTVQFGLSAIVYP